MTDLLRNVTQLHERKAMVFYTVERKMRGKWVPVSKYGLWNEGRKALDRLQNQHGANYVRMRQTTNPKVGQRA